MQCERLLSKKGSVLMATWGSSSQHLQEQTKTSPYKAEEEKKQECLKDTFVFRFLRSNLEQDLIANGALQQ